MSKRFGRVLVGIRTRHVLLAWLLAVLPITARADKSIFDDDYWETDPEPAPTQKHTPVPVAPTPTPVVVPPTSAPKPEPTKPVAPAPVPATVPSIPLNPATKRATVRKLRVPTLEQQAASEKAVRDAFAPQLADKTRTGRRYVSDLLVFKSQTDPDAANRYGMLALARDLAADAGDVRRALRAINAMEAAYHINGPKMRVDSFVRAKIRFADPLDHSAAVTEGLQLMDHLSAVAAYRQLPVLTPVIRQSALRADDKALAATIKQATLDADAVAVEFDKAKVAADLLKQSPNDATANLVVGRFLCLFRDDWKTGLPKLLKASGTDPLYFLAVQETAGSIKPPAQRKQLAEAWWAYAESTKTSPPLRKRAQFRACAWYGTILESLTGIEKATAEKRLSDARVNGVDVDALPSDFSPPAN